MQKIMIASNNAGKVKEFKAMLSSFGAEVYSLQNLPEAIDVEETGDTFYENARLKAEVICKKTNMITIADDSGLVIDALDGRPGVYSARYAGPEKDDKANLLKVLKELESVAEAERSAKFVCVLAVSVPGKETKFAEGECVGFIQDKPYGDNGFGYDPIFYFPGADTTLAGMSQEEKNKISHRANALKELQRHWRDWVGDN
ncbi:XTP/dITP diphosphohydrolase [Scopulibacillus darangshiensis]|uniref:dITP/XTP pyrophosphatase n=1 Tax=Scopulibacillus darangshiensis TaxID=442528 RepID=A0A4V2SNR2_9BACL|nr:XTP/dITP diphosphatase [Scopulibacillus darangshiensis]TCP32146.1 XTP/dITP diphosphohydrolase [Scopulibacillus darangshiensis]